MSKDNKRLSTRRTSRRSFLAASAAVGATALAAPYVRPAKAAEPLKVGTYGGYFEESFRSFIYPDFTAETGIEVESIPEPTGQTWIIQIRNAAKAGIAPADVSMMAGVPRLRGAAEKLWLPLDEAARCRKRYRTYIRRMTSWTGIPTARLYGVGAVSWFITLCSAILRRFPEAPTSWGDMWDPKYKDSLGLLALPDPIHTCWRVTAKTFFGGPWTYCRRKDGVEKVLQAKLDRGQAQTCGFGTRTRAPSNRRCKTARSRWGSTTTTLPRLGGGGRLPRCALRSRRRAASTTRAPGW